MDSKSEGTKASFRTEAARHFISGGLSGLVSALAFQPLDVLKTRMQKLKPEVSLPRATKKGPVLSVNSFTLARQIIQQDGAKGLWRGLEPTIIRMVPGSGIYFLTIQAMTNMLTSPERPKLSPTESALVGALSRSTMTLVLSPVSVVKTRFEAGDVQYKNTLDAFKTIYRTEGFRALFSGLIPTILRDAPYAGIQLLFYNEIRVHLRPYKESGVLGIPLNDTFINFSSGFIGGFLATLVTHPFDVLKTRMQLEQTSQKSSAWKFAKAAFANEGFVGFYRGFGPRILRRALQSSILWTVYEEGARLFKRLTGA